MQEQQTRKCGLCVVLWLGAKIKSVSRRGEQMLCRPVLVHRLQGQLKPWEGCTSNTQPWAAHSTGVKLQGVWQSTLHALHLPWAGGRTVLVPLTKCIFWSSILLKKKIEKNNTPRFPKLWEFIQCFVLFGQVCKEHLLLNTSQENAGLFSRTDLIWIYYCLISCGCLAKF